MHSRTLLAVLTIVVSLLVSACEPKYRAAERAATDAFSKNDNEKGKRLAREALRQIEQEGRGSAIPYDSFLVSVAYYFPLEEQIELWSHAIDLAEQSSDESSLYRRYSALGDVYYSKQMFAQALSPLKRALDIRIGQVGADDFGLAGIPKVSGPYDPVDYATRVHAPYFKVATCYEQTGRFKEAEPLRRKILELNENRFGKEYTTEINSNDVQEFVIDLADNLAAQHKYGEAEHLYKRAITVSERRMKEVRHKGDYEFAPRACAGLAKMYAVEGLSQKADTFYKRALKAADQAFDSNQVKRDYAQFLRRHGRSNEAAEYERQVKAVEEFNKAREGYQK